MPAPAVIDWRSLVALAFEWAVVAAAVAATVLAGSAWVAAAAFFVIATRQHAQLILYHDAVHGHIARNRRVNDFIINLAVGIPMLLPVEVYRPLHLQHHGRLGTADDPERRLLYNGQAWQYRPLTTGKLLRQIGGDLLLVNGIRTLVSWGRSQPFPAMPGQTIVTAAAWIVLLGLWFWLAPTIATVAVALWLLPLVTVTQLLQKLRSFAEHSGGPGVTPGWHDWTYSWRAGLAGRLTIWPYHINFHREHHEQPALHWHELPAAAGSAGQLPGRFLWRLLWMPEAQQARD